MSRYETFVATAVPEWHGSKAPVVIYTAAIYMRYTWGSYHDLLRRSCRDGIPQLRVWQQRVTKRQAAGRSPYGDLNQDQDPKKPVDSPSSWAFPCRWPGSDSPLGPSCGGFSELEFGALGRRSGLCFQFSEEAVLRQSADPALLVKSSGWTDTEPPLPEAAQVQRPADDCSLTCPLASPLAVLCVHSPGPLRCTLAGDQGCPVACHLLE
nr:PREDICTED: uncharacterized protein LOC107078724 isoform X2 [Lepisosteus oculatus]